MHREPIHFCLKALHQYRVWIVPLTCSNQRRTFCTLRLLYANMLHAALAVNAVCHCLTLCDTVCPWPVLYVSPLAVPGVNVCERKVLRCSGLKNLTLGDLLAVTQSLPGVRVSEDEVRTLVVSCPSQQHILQLLHLWKSRNSERDVGKALAQSQRRLRSRGVSKRLLKSLKRIGRIIGASTMYRLYEKMFFNMIQDSTCFKSKTYNDWPAWPVFRQQNYLREVVHSSMTREGKGGFVLYLEWGWGFDVRTGNMGLRPLVFLTIDLFYFFGLDCSAHTKIT